MPTQSRARPVPLLLTRPEPQATDFAHALQARFGTALRIIRTPLLAPRFYAPELPKRRFAGLILTSQTGVEAFVRLGIAAQGLPKAVYCVGQHTAEVAREAGLQPVLIAQDAAGLILQIKAYPPQGALLHLRGRETRASIENSLNLAGIDTVSVVGYAQEMLPLSAEARAVLQSNQPVLIPLFSPRTAAIFVAEATHTSIISRLFVAALSRDVALELGGLATQIKIADSPDAAALLGSVAMLLAQMQRA